ncbi:MAG: hypothetical protein JW780_07550 [Clostridiales bacterium]|nr:hypothetical protein [Clostridiales bacterium]
MDVDTNRDDDLFGRVDGLIPGAVSESSAELARLRKILDRQMLITEAMWTLMKDNGYTEEALRDKIVALDHRDDSTKKEIKKPVPLCPECKNPLQKTEGIVSRCIYCGYEETGDPFDTL